MSSAQTTRPHLHRTTPNRTALKPIFIGAGAGAGAGAYNRKTALQGISTRKPHYTLPIILLVIWIPRTKRSLKFFIHSDGKLDSHSM